jgi:hypothetical protein
MDYKLYIDNKNARIVIEPNLIFRGFVYPSQKMDLTLSAEMRFKTSVLNVPIASVHDVYAGKMCAALDRQHPRDLFDIKLLFEKEGITTELKQAFLIYLASNNRPMYELLDPNRLDQQHVYQDEFLGMTDREISYEALIETREILIKTIHELLIVEDKEFLFSIKRGKPDWTKVKHLTHIDQLPGIRWKLLNISRMTQEKHHAALNKLEKVLA